jgi:hypothetical protein
LYISADAYIILLKNRNVFLSFFSFPFTFFTSLLFDLKRSCSSSSSVYWWFYLLTDILRFPCFQTVTFTRKCILVFVSTIFTENFRISCFQAVTITRKSAHYWDFYLLFCTKNCRFPRFQGVLRGEPIINYICCFRFKWYCTVDTSRSLHR